MSKPLPRVTSDPIRIGAVTYLNARPLTHCLPALLPEAEIVVDVPSRLAERLWAGELDVALVPSIEHFRIPGSSIVSDACIACDGPVRSVKLYGRCPVQRIRSLALDDGSRTSAVLSRILLKERFCLEPAIQPLPIDCSLEESSADAVLVIGDRGMQPPQGEFEFIWDLGEQWSCWTGLPFVFALWIARPGAEVQVRQREQSHFRADVSRPCPKIGTVPLGAVLAAARDEGITRLADIARQAAPAVGLPEADCLAYLRDHLEFHFGDRQRRGLELFYQLAVRHELAPAGAELVFSD